MKFYYSSRGEKTLTIVEFLLPSIFGAVCFCIIPICFSLYLGFTDWDIIGGVPHFIGFNNYQEILKSEEFWRVLKNTLYFIILYIPLILITSLAMAVYLNKDYKGMTIYRVLYYIPVLTSWVAGALIWKWLLNPQFGVVNAVLGYLGIDGPGWIYDQKWAMPGIVLASIWKDVGYFALIFLGGLKGINKTYYEVADIDGANKWQKLTKVTLPLLSPSIFFVVIISIINSFQLFPQVNVMTEGGPHGATQVMVERIYRYAFNYYKMGYAAAFSWILFAFIFIATLIQLKLQKRWVNYDA